MKKLWIIGSVLTAVIIILSLVGCSAGTTGGNTVVANQQQGIWVTGEGKVTVTPDIVNISMGVQSNEASVAVALQKASGAMDNIMAVLKTNKIADSDIQTQQFSVNPQYSYDQASGKQNITGYNVTNTVNVKLRDISSVGTIIDAVVTAGGNLTVINNVNFTVEDPTRYYDDARQKAVDDANVKAKEIASLSGVTLGKPTYIVEISSSLNPIFYGNSASGSAIMSSQSSTPVNAGSTDIVLDIQVSYSISN